jgi:Uma2 family endonuclease
MAEATRTRITAAEYGLLPETTRPRELIDGEIIEPPMPKDVHQKLLGLIYRLLLNLIPGGELRFAPVDVYLDDFNVVQPDIFWVSGPESRCKLGDDDYWHGAPDLVIEVLSPSTALRDRREKFQLYQKHGAREYWMVDPVALFVEVWEFPNRKGIFSKDESFECAALSGKQIVVKAMFEA